MNDKDIQQYVPLEVIRNDQISCLFPDGRKLSVKQANAEDFFAFLEGSVEVVNVKNLSIFIRWHALNIGLEAGTLALSQDESGYIIAKAEPKSAEDVA